MAFVPRANVVAGELPTVAGAAQGSRADYFRARVNLFKYSEDGHKYFTVTFIADDHPIVREGLKQVLAGALDLNVMGKRMTAPRFSSAYPNTSSKRCC